MYIPAHFALNQPEEQQRIIRSHALGMLVWPGPTGMDAEHIPFEFDPANGPHGLLTAHVARNNPIWQQCPNGATVMVVFRGAEAYISPNWYPSKHEAHRLVPTWNYEVVHVHGTITFHDDERHVRGVVARLSRRHEAAEPKPWKIGDSAPEFIDSMLKNIVGVEVAVTSIVGKSKLSQNRELRDRTGAANTLLARGQEELGTQMRKGLGEAT